MKNFGCWICWLLENTETNHCVKMILLSFFILATSAKRFHFLTLISVFLRLPAECPDTWSTDYCDIWWTALGQRVVSAWDLRFPPEHNYCFSAITMTVIIINLAPNPNGRFSWPKQLFYFTHFSLCCLFKSVSITNNSIKVNSLILLYLLLFVMLLRHGWLHWWNLILTPLIYN